MLKHGAWEKTKVWCLIYLSCLVWKVTNFIPSKLVSYVFCGNHTLDLLIHFRTYNRNKNQDWSLTNKYSKFQLQKCNRIPSQRFIT